jgi:hypothetical protein
MDLYDKNHEKPIYTSIDFIEFVIEKAKTKIHPDFLAKEFNFYNLNEKFKKSIDVLGWEEFKNVTNEFIKKVEKQ